MPWIPPGSVHWNLVVLPRQIPNHMPNRSIRAREASDGAQWRDARRQVRSREGPGLPVRHAGDRSRCADAEGARPRAGLNTAGFISGYRGSPLGGLDQQLWRAGELLKANDIVFQPGLNEDLAATSVWGSQQAELRGEGRYDGVFSIWYGKGPGVDRSRRCAAPRQLRRHLAAWRRDRADGRRPHLRKLHHRAPVGVRLRRRDDPDPEPGRASRRSSTTG